MIISRYLIKEVLDTLLAVTAVLLLIVLSNQLVRYLSYAASGKIGTNILLQLLGFETPPLIAILLPLGFYLGIMLAYGRLYADNEMSVLNACGFSTRRLLSVTSLFAVLVTLTVVALTLWLNPIVAAKKQRVMAQDNIINTLQSGRFHVINGGKRVIYVEKISRDRKEASNIFIAERRDNATHKDDQWIVLSANQGYQMKEPVTRDRFIVAADGYRYDGVPGQNNYKIVEFGKYAVRLALAGMENKRQREEVLPTAQLWKEYQNPDYAAELQWRISLPISAFLLALMAIPFSHVKPRQGRYSLLLPAILIYVIYVNMMFVARNWVEQEIVSVDFGMWWVHGIMFVLAMILILLQSRANLRAYFMRKISS